MSVTGAAWQRIWKELGAQVVNGGLFNQLVQAYSERHRHYHTLEHLRECLRHLEAVRSLARRPAEVELALWFHDAVYDPRRSDNEERSAGWSRDSVRAAGCDGAIAQRLHALVLVTKHHGAAPDDPDAALLRDIDLAILGASLARFDTYETQIRAEYAHLPDAEFRTGRRSVLHGFLERPRIYATAVFHDALEQRARENLIRAIARL